MKTPSAIHQQNALAAPEGIHQERVVQDGLPWGCRRLIFGQSGQVYFEYGPLPRPAAAENMPAMELHDAKDRGEPQAGALTHRLGGEKRIKNLIDGVLVHALAGIGHLHKHVGSRVKRWVRLAKVVVQPGIAGLEQELAAFGHGILCVCGQVDQDLLDLIFVAFDHFEARGQFCINAYHFAIIYLTNPKGLDSI